VKENLLDAQAVAELLGMRASTIREWARRGVLASVRVRHRVRFRPADLSKIMVERPARRGGHAAQNGEASCSKIPV